MRGELWGGEGEISFIILGDIKFELFGQNY
jgi:hypothetical protein